MQGVGLCSGMLAWVPGYAAAGIIALISPLYLAVLPILAPVRHHRASCHPMAGSSQDLYSESGPYISLQGR